MVERGGIILTPEPVAHYNILVRIRISLENYPRPFIFLSLVLKKSPSWRRSQLCGRHVEPKLSGKDVGIPQQPEAAHYMESFLYPRGRGKLEHPENCVSSPIPAEPSPPATETTPTSSRASTNYCSSHNYSLAESWDKPHLEDSGERGQWRTVEDMSSGGQRRRVESLKCGRSSSTDRQQGPDSRWSPAPSMTDLPGLLSGS